MALGTITAGTHQRKSAFSPLDVVQLTFAGESSYVKGTGTAGFQALVRTALSQTVNVIGIIQSGITTKYIPIYDKTNDALKLIDMNTADEAANASYSAHTFNIMVLFG